MGTTKMIKDTLLEFMVRSMFNTALLMGLMFPVLNIKGELAVTLFIVVVLDLANRVFTNLWTGE